MALRVLLADESSTIKKVFQLALQDFAVEVRPVNVGLDVVLVAQNFKPDIIFADVMLQKRSGYEVAAELKQHAELQGIPVVLMWSGFIELDEDKFQASHANAQLEKPFDVTALRKLVTDLVPRTQNQRLSQFLAFPPMPEIDEGKGPAQAAAQPEEEAAPPPFPEEDFQQVSIPKMKGANQDKYRLNLKPEELEPNHVPVDVEEIFSTAESEDEPFTMKETRRSQEKPALPPIPKTPTQTSLETHADAHFDDVTPVTGVGARKPAPPPPLIPTLSAEQLEKIIREQSAEVIESIVWKVVPDLATQIIERELNRLLKERDAQQY